MTRRHTFILLSPLILAGFLAFAALGGEIVKLLWNWLIPPVFGWRTLTFWQALGLLALCRILFGGFRLGGGHSRSRIRRRMRDRWEHMSPDEREHLRRRMRERLFGSPPANETHTE